MRAATTPQRVKASRAKNNVQTTAYGRSERGLKIRFILPSTVSSRCSHGATPPASWPTRSSRGRNGASAPKMIAGSVATLASNTTEPSRLLTTQTGIGDQGADARLKAGTLNAPPGHHSEHFERLTDFVFDVHQFVLRGPSMSQQRLQTVVGLALGKHRLEPASAHQLCQPAATGPVGLVALDFENSSLTMRLRQYHRHALLTTDAPSFLTIPDRFLPIRRRFYDRSHRPLPPSRDWRHI